MRLDTAAISRCLLAALVCFVSVAALPSFARADGDPASDYLVARQVFLSSQPTWSQASQHELLNVVAAANRAGFPIRVAVISSDYDLGSITALWRKPRIYARFLGLELALAYKQRLLVIMPNGFGFSWPHHPVGPTYRLLAKIPIPSAAAGSLDAARTAVRQLATAAGVTVPTVTKGRTNQTLPATGGRSNDRVAFIAAGLAALAAGLGGLFALGRRRRARTEVESHTSVASPTGGAHSRLGAAWLCSADRGRGRVADSGSEHLPASRRFGQFRGSSRDIASVHLARGPPAGA